MQACVAIDLSITEIYHIFQGLCQFNSHIHIIALGDVHLNGNITVSKYYIEKCCSLEDNVQSHVLPNISYRKNLKNSYLFTKLSIKASQMFHKS